MCYWSLNWISKAKLKLESGNRKRQYGCQTAILKMTSLNIYRLLPRATRNMHMKFEIEIPKQTWVMLQKPWRWIQYRPPPPPPNFVWGGIKIYNNYIVDAMELHLLHETIDTFWVLYLKFVRNKRRQMTFFYTKKYVNVSQPLGWSISTADEEYILLFMVLWAIQPSVKEIKIAHKDWTICHLSFADEITTINIFRISLQWWNCI